MYKYEDMKDQLFTENGFQVLTEIRDNVKKALKDSGAFQAEKVFCSGDTWLMLASLDYLVEKGEIKELERNCSGQYRTFVDTRT